MAPFRIERPATKRAARPTPDEQFRSYLDRLMRMIPREVVALYLVGSGLIPKDESKWWLVVWTAVCLFGVFAIRMYGTRDPQAGKGPQWPSILIAAAAFVIWVYSLGGPFIAFELYK